jgi:hypothetical protein
VSQATGIFLDYFRAIKKSKKLISLSTTEWKSIMKLRMDRTLKFWVDVAYEDIRSDHPNLTKRQLLAHILCHYEARGDAMRDLDADGTIAWKASPMMLMGLSDAERDAEAELADFP